MGSFLACPAGSRTQIRAVVVYQPFHFARREARTPVNRSRKETLMGLGVSLILIAAGAILAFAVHVTTSGFNVTTVGIILLVVGTAGALISLMFWSSGGGFGGRRTVVEEGAPVPARRTVVRDEVV